MKIQAEMRIKFKKYIKLWIPECDIPYWHVPTVFWEIITSYSVCTKNLRANNHQFFLLQDNCDFNFAVEFEAYINNVWELNTGAYGNLLFYFNLFSNWQSLQNSVFGYIKPKKLVEFTYFYVIKYYLVPIKQIEKNWNRWRNNEIMFFLNS